MSYKSCINANHTSHQNIQLMKIKQISPIWEAMGSSSTFHNPRTGKSFIGEKLISGREVDSVPYVSDMRIVGGMGGMPIAYGTKSRKMWNHDADDHKLSLFLIIAYIYDAIFT